MENENQFLGAERVGKLMLKYAVPCVISLLVGACKYRLSKALPQK